MRHNKMISILIIIIIVLLFLKNIVLAEDKENSITQNTSNININANETENSKYIKYKY